MSTVKAKASISKSEFDKISVKLKARLSSKLAAEIQTDEFAANPIDSGAATDLWDLPVVPSKSVVKLSGIVEEMLGVKLPTRFIQSGGYQSLEEAIEHITSQLRDLCID